MIGTCRIRVDYRGIITATVIKWLCALRNTFIDKGMGKSGQYCIGNIQDTETQYDCGKPPSHGITFLTSQLIFGQVLY
jgi:hypothetical protein